MKPKQKKWKTRNDFWLFTFKGRKNISKRQAQNYSSTGIEKMSHKETSKCISQLCYFRSRTQTRNKKKNSQETNLEQ